MDDESEDVERPWIPLAPQSSLVNIGWSQEEERKKQKPSRKKKSKGNEKKAKKRKVAKEEHKSIANANTVIQPKSLVEVGPDYIDTNGRTLTLDGEAYQTPCLEGHALVHVIAGCVRIMGFELNTTSEVVVNFPSWSNSVPIKVIGKSATVKVQSISKAVNATVKSFASATRPITVSQSWESACVRVLGDDENGIRIPPSSDSSRVLICGAKSTGKSTFLRFLVNRYLSHCKSVVVLDCDVGQPELGPPGMLTLTLVKEPLLSLPHVHMKREHLKAYFLGHVTSRNDPTTYLEMITDLLQVYSQSFEGHGTSPPLLINTDGWVKGFGFEVLTTIIERVRPTHVVQMTSNTPSKAFNVESSLPKNSTLIGAEAFESQSAIDIPPHALRSLRLSSYFCEDASVWDRIDFGSMGIVDHDCEIANTLAAQKPYVVAIDSVRCEVPFVTSPSAVLDSLNGSLVGLGIDIADERHPSCIGLGIVRGIDRQHGLLYILSPVPVHKIMNVVVLVKGTIELPIPCVYRGMHAEALPYIACSLKADCIGGEIMKSRQNIGRKSLQRMG